MTDQYKWHGPATMRELQAQLHGATRPDPEQYMDREPARPTSSAMELMPNKIDPATMSFGDLLQLAQSPGPMQGMAMAKLQDIIDVDNRVDTTGSRHNGQLNMGEDESRPSYPDELMKALVSRYGYQAAAPTTEDAPTRAPAPEAQQQFMDEMQRMYPEPSVWDKTKRIFSGIAADPGALAEPAADMAGYVTPVMGNYKGTQDFGRDVRAMQDDQSDPLSKIINHSPGLVMDGLQSLSPVGIPKGAGIGEAMSKLIAAYGSGSNGARPALARVLRNFAQ